MPELTGTQWLAALVFAATLAAFVWDRFRYDLVAMGALLACVLLGLVPPEKAFDGFGNPAVITVAAVLILGHALARTGTVQVLGEQVSRFSSNKIGQLVAICAVGAALSAFMNNVGALAILMPIALASARKLDYSPALVLMPLSFATMLGGMCTLIGTPPNLLASAYRQRYADAPFDFFSFAPAGVAITLAGLAFMCLIGWRLLPRDRQGQRSAIEAFDIGRYVTEVALPKGSTLIDKTVDEVENASGDKLIAINLTRSGLRIRSHIRHTKLKEGDDLFLQADAEYLQELVRKGDLEIVTARTSEGEDVAVAAPTALETMEAVVPPNSWIQGQTAAGLQFRARFGINLLAMSRQGRPITKRLRHTPLFAGDVLLLEGDSDQLPDAVRDMACLPLVKRGIALSPFNVWLPVGVFAVAIGMVVVDLLPAQVAFILAVLAMLALRLVPVRELYDSVDWPVIVLLAAMIPVGGALESSGLAALIAEQAVSARSVLPDIGMLGLVLLITMVVTPMLNNAATVVVMAPIAIGIAQSLGVNPDAFLMAVAIGASCDFLTPFGHQNNTLILAPGGYRFSDYWKLGLPLDIIVIAGSLLILPVVFPLR